MIYVELRQRSHVYGVRLRSEDLRPQWRITPFVLLQLTFHCYENHTHGQFPLSYENIIYCSTGGRG